MKIASISEPIRQKMTASGRIFMTRPMVPPTMVRGRNAKQVVATATATGSMTSFEPSIAASIRDLPISRWRWTFSITTIASSTMMPVAMSRPKVEMTLIVMSVLSIRKVASRYETGMPHSASRAWRKPATRARTRTTRIAPEIPLTSTVLSRSRISEV